MSHFAPLVLVIIDGWGLASPSPGNAIYLAKTPTFDRLEQTPYVKLRAAGEAVGLPDNQHGNSEAGHMNLGAGRIVSQDDMRIQVAIKTGDFFTNQRFLKVLSHVKAKARPLHLLGLLTDGQSAHADPVHLYALLDLCQRQDVPQVYLHLFTDGRDTPPRHALALLSDLQSRLAPGQVIVSLCGRVNAMDRKKDWPRTEQAYRLLTEAVGRRFVTAEQAITAAYSQGLTDEFLEPSVISSDRPVAIGDNDGVIFFNLRSDRARQLMKALAQKDFETANPGVFTRQVKPAGLSLVAMTDFGPDLPEVLTAFPMPDIVHTLPWALRSLRQLYLAEAEKFSHITFFFNGGVAGAIAGEERQMVPSPDLKHYEQQPAMATDQLINIVIDNLKQGRYDFQCVNLAAPDMIAHTGNLAATIKAVEVTDQAIGRLLTATSQIGAWVMITADHGNAEELINLATGEINTEHSSSLVPFYLAAPGYSLDTKHSDLVLGHVAPTVCDSLGQPIPKEMTCQSLLLH